MNVNPSNLYFMVYDDREGSFVDILDIQSVKPRPEDQTGSVITLKSNAKELISPLKVREILKRINVIRYKREQEQEHGRTLAPDQGNLFEKLDKD